MAKVNLVEKVVKLELNEIVKFQILTHCHLHKKIVSEADIDCLTMLGVLGESELTSFCDIVANQKIFKTTQTVRNCLSRMQKLGLVIKNGPSKSKTIKIEPKLEIQTSGNILLIYKVAHVNPS